MARTVRSGTNKPRVVIRDCRFERNVVIDGTLVNALNAQASANRMLAEALYTVVERALVGTEEPMLTITDRETDDGKAKAEA